MLELVCAAIVAFYTVLRLRLDPSPRRRALRLAAIAVAAWAAEETVITLYGLYTYGSRWWVVLGRVPVLVALIWPVVIQSAEDLARQFVGASATHARLALATGTIVLVDAALIEPVAVHEGLWSWSAPGLFGVPLVGLFGWGAFGAWVTWLSESNRLGLRARTAIAIVGPLVLLHPTLIAAWWSVFRWLPVSIPAESGIAVAWLVALGLATWLHLRRMGPRVAHRWVWLRLPGALFFFALVAWPPVDTTLVLYAFAFTVPYVALLAARRQ